MFSTTVLRPGDEGHESELAGFRLGFVRRPAIAVAARGIEDVPAGVAHAAEAGLAVLAQATGHGTPGPVDGGPLINTRRMDGIRLDAAARTTRVGEKRRERQRRRPTSFQAVGSAPIARAAFNASPIRNGTRPTATASPRDMPVASAR